MDASEEIDRVIPVIEGLIEAEVAASISIDTSKAQVAERALAAGATIVNDVTALGDPEMAGVCARAEAQLILMHMKGTPRTMQDDPTYEDVVAEVSEFLAARVASAVEAGIAEGRILIDPGIGFGKTVDHNLELIERLGELRSLGRLIVFGASRKSFIGKIGGGEAADRLGGTIAANVLALERGADVLRVHDVAPAREAVLVAEAIIGGWQWTGMGPAPDERRRRGHQDRTSRARGGRPAWCDRRRARGGLPDRARHLVHRRVESARSAPTSSRTRSTTRPSRRLPSRSSKNAAATRSSTSPR